jgi:hypothetical protein
LSEIEKELEKLDPSYLNIFHFSSKDFEEMTKGFDEETPELFPQNTNVVELNVDTVRGPEIFFQPSLVGVDQVKIFIIL